MAIRISLSILGHREGLTITNVLAQWTHMALISEMLSPMICTFCPSLYCHMTLYLELLPTWFFFPQFVAWPGVRKQPTTMVGNGMTVGSNDMLGLLCDSLVKMSVRVYDPLVCLSLTTLVHWSRQVLTCYLAAISYTVHCLLMWYVWIQICLPQRTFWP